MAEFSGSERTVAEYLLAEVLDRQPDEVRRLLLRTSVLERAQFVTSPINMVSDDLSAPPQKWAFGMVHNSIGHRLSWCEISRPAGAPKNLRNI